MKTLNRQKLDVVNQTRSNPALRAWRGQFTPDFVACVTAAGELISGHEHDFSQRPQEEAREAMAQVGGQG
jgi:hypothetical protein